MIRFTPSGGTSFSTTPTRPLGQYDKAKAAWKKGIALPEPPEL